MSSACVAVPKMIQYKEHQVVSLRIYNCGDGVLAYSVTIYNRSVLAYRAVLFINLIAINCDRRSAIYIFPAFSIENIKRCFYSFDICCIVFVDSQNITLILAF